MHMMRVSLMNPTKIAVICRRVATIGIANGNATVGTTPDTHGLASGLKSTKNRNIRNRKAIRASIRAVWIDIRVPADNLGVHVGGQENHWQKPQQKNQLVHFSSFRIWLKKLRMRIAKESQLKLDSLSGIANRQTIQQSLQIQQNQICAYNLAVNKRRSRVAP